MRDAADPQLTSPTGKIGQAERGAGQIYAEWGAFTTAARAIAGWAILDVAFN